ncbi:hypothetical protein [Aurantiacibacter rhizosphaerae]|uniref:Sel1 repeat family protein n=1 Tax=Aurantiacibacter rhizosphaerae TaxID=2691582 RepID=A0A844XAG9_9SPHN|nr:hypothetical protein [Aurantiacibacter rhizosphaerae]MWV26525.1 hypothetical protein [Aurantiacibacter rhizosphaerae]
MIARVTIAGLALLMAIVACFAQLDQQSRLDPSYALMVPDAFSGNAARERAKMELQLGQGQAALASATMQIKHRPLPAESLTILALSAISAGEEEPATDALSAASRRGWREPIAQLASAESALSQGQYQGAAQRIAALMAMGTLSAPTEELLGRLLQTPEGQQAFAERLAAFGRWQNNALLTGYRAGGASAWASTLARANELGADFNCNRLGLLAKKYGGHQNAADLAKFWPGDCKSS